MSDRFLLQKTLRMFRLKKREKFLTFNLSKLVMDKTENFQSPNASPMCPDILDYIVVQNGSKRVENVQNIGLKDSADV